MTPFGARLRALRAQRGLTLKDMASALGVTSSYLSALEHGRRGRPPWYMVQRCIAYFNVIWDEAEELQRLAELSDPRVVIDSANLSPAHTALSNTLARVIARIDAEEAAELLRQVERIAKKSDIATSAESGSIQGVARRTE